MKNYSQLNYKGEICCIVETITNLHLNSYKILQGQFKIKIQKRIYINHFFLFNLTLLSNWHFRKFVDYPFFEKWSTKHKAIIIYFVNNNFTINKYNYENNLEC